MRENRGQVLGEVVSSAMNKTIAVVVERSVKHKKYGKFLKKSSTFKAHDATQLAKVGDRVVIAQCRPISKTKRWVLVEVVSKAGGDL